MLFRSLALITLAIAPLAAQSPALPGPNVGDIAPAFTAPAADKSGPLAAPISLASLKGKTVVLAFFPRARTSGCTAQMEAYRDQYAELFAGGNDVVLLGVSTDADTTLANWAKEKGFPFQFVSDVKGEVGKAYGTLAEGATAARRYLYVIDPQGKISYTVKPVNPLAPKQYEELGVAVKKAKTSN
jgi:thioredoxin-dependent peroxiredoxin